MPASTLEPVNAALSSALSKNCSNKSLDNQIAGSTKKTLLSDIEFEPAGSYQSTVLDLLKSKYIVLKSSESPKASKPENMGADETLTLAKCILYPLENVQLGWNNSDWSVGCGMVNMGNTCYLNSTLQALFHVPALVNWLISDKQHVADCQDSGGSCIICAMRKTLQDSQNRTVNTIRPFLIYNKLRIVCRNLIPGRQEDAHEFLRYLVEAMEKAYLNRFKNNSEFDSRTKETTPLNQILGGYLRSAVRCLECGHVSTTFQHFQDLLLDIRKTQTLDEALEAYFSREKLDDESYHCEACQKKVPATKQFSLERAPMVLCIQLKRFSVSNNKITKHVQFRQRLELTRYARHRPSVPLVYRLVALVTHMGPTVSCGHYTAVAQAPSGNFYQFDDSMVRPISHQAVFSTNAYIMLYELESAPFSAKSATVTNKLKAATTSSPSPSPPNEHKYTIPKMNGVTGEKVYGPELPANFAEKGASLTRVFTNSAVNGVKHSDSSEGESERKQKLSDKENNGGGISNGKVNGNSPARNMPDLSTKTAPEVPKLTNKEPPMTENTKKGQPTTKLVPYDVDDSSNYSDESGHSPAEAETRLVSKSTVGDWKVSQDTSNVAAEPSATSRNWESKRSPTGNGRNTVGELLRMSHSGYGAPVASWNGTRAQLDKEVNGERREDRKRALICDNLDQGRVKHQKVNNNSYKSNPGYNPIQEFHNAKNWNQNGSQHYRQFFNNGNRHRRNFHHKNFHKNYRFRH